jgi:hypothetical protein
MAKFRRLIWDIEVSPNIGMFWQSGYKISIPPENILVEREIICIAYKWEGEKKVYHLEWDKKQSDKKLCREFTKVLNSADQSVGHNLDKYDLKFFNGRCLHNGLRAPDIPATIDTLVIARRRMKLNSNKLDYIAKVMGLGGKHHTDFSLWKSILIDKCPKAMARMVRYCKQDVALTEKVFQELQTYHNVKIHMGVAEGGDRWSCPECGSESLQSRGTEATRGGVMRHVMRCKCCGRSYRISQHAFKLWREWKEE